MATSIYQTRPKGKGSAGSKKKGAQSNEYQTPLWVFAFLDAIFHFTIDVAATNQNHRCRTWFTKFTNGLSKRWFGRVFLNPPYSDIRAWVAKCAEEAKSGTLIVALLPNWTGAAWFDDFCADAVILPVAGRIKFIKDGDAQAIFDSMIVLWNASQFELRQLNAKTLDARLLTIPKPSKASRKAL